MLNRKQFKEASGPVIEWIDEYFRRLESLPVKSMVKPGEILSALSYDESNEPSSVAALLKELEEIILPGITHWQHPNFHAYFPANSSIESLLAEFITAAIGAQCMIWQTSPAAAELEEYVLDWLKPYIGIPDDWEGVIQDTASTATLAAIITARESFTDFTSNDEGVPTGMRVYGSSQTHSSIEKAVGIAGIGRKNFVPIAVDGQGAMSAEALEQAIKTDLESGLKPFCAVATVGTTGTVAVDPVRQIGEICQRYNLWLHVDAAYAGSALVLQEYQWMIDGIELSDSFVFNPHKWMFTNFDCSLYYVKSAADLIRTFEILPEYLKTSTRGEVNDYRDWGIPLGRRFRALKLWFVLRGIGIDEIRKRLRLHIELAESFSKKLDAVEGLSLMSGPFLNFFTFRCDTGNDRVDNTYTRSLLERLNASGVMFASHTMIDELYVIRMVIGQTYVEQRHVDIAFNAIKKEWDLLRKLQA